jgi:hypothetical protein
MTKRLTLLLLSTVLSLLSFNTQAEQCSINFNYGVIIDPNHIRIIEHGKTIVQINHTHQLFVNGREITLTNKQQRLIEQFSSGIRQQVPKIVSIAIDGVDIGLKAVNKVIGGLTGENSASQQKIQVQFDELKWRLRKRFNQSANNYYIALQDFDDLDDIFTGEFEEIIDEVISNSIGSILIVVGDAITSSNDEQGNGEQRISTFDEKMESMSKDLELEISSSADALKKKAIQFCQNLTLLNKIENQIQYSIPELADFNLIETN